MISGIFCLGLRGIRRMVMRSDKGMNLNGLASEKRLYE